jgi:hypothetical protein
MQLQEQGTTSAGRRAVWAVLLVFTPLLLVGGAMLLFTARHERAEIARSTLEVSRALATAVDAELNAALSALGILASAESLEYGDLEAFRRSAQRAMQVRPSWTTIIVADLSGRALLHTNAAPGTAPPPVADRASFDAFVRNPGPRVGNIAAGTSGDFRFPVRVPVFHDGKADRVLTAVIDPRVIRALVDRQRVVPGSVISVLDAQDRHVARSRGDAEYRGKEAAASLRAMIRGGHEGGGSSVTLEGDAIYAGFSRLPASGWTVAVGVPRTRVERLRTMGYALLGPGLLLLLVLAGLTGQFLVRATKEIGELQHKGPKAP